MVSRHARRHARNQNWQSNHSVGVGEAHSVEGESAQPVNERWERAQAARAAALAAGASAEEAYQAAQEAYEA
jgi:hypothetical protein